MFQGNRLMPDNTSALVKGGSSIDIGGATCVETIADVSEHSPVSYDDADFQVTIIRDRYEFADHRDKWDVMLDSHSGASLHIGSEYIDAVLTTMGDTIEAYIIIIEKAGEVVALAPLQKSTYPYYGLHLKVAAPLDHKGYGRSDIAIFDLAGHVIPVLRRAVRRQMKVDLWHFDRFPSDSTICRCVLENEDTYSIEHYADLEVATLDSRLTWEDFIAAKSKNFRRSYNRMLSNAKGLRHLMLVGRAIDVEAFIADVQEISAGSWKSEAGSDFANDTSRLDFLKELAGKAAEKGNFVGAMLFDGNKPVAFTFGIIRQGILYALETGYLPEYGDRSVGIRSYAMLMQHCFDNDQIIRCDMDLIKDRGGYKRRWATGYEQRLSLFLLVGGLGSIAIRAGRLLARIKTRLS